MIISQSQTGFFLNTQTLRPAHIRDCDPSSSNSLDWSAVPIETKEIDCYPWPSNSLTDNPFESYWNKRDWLIPLGFKLTRLHDSSYCVWRSQHSTRELSKVLFAQKFWSTSIINQPMVSCSFKFTTFLYFSLGTTKKVNNRLIMINYGNDDDDWIMISSNKTFYQLTIRILASFVYRQTTLNEFHKILVWCIYTNLLRVIYQWLWVPFEKIKNRRRFDMWF